MNISKCSNCQQIIPEGHTTCFECGSIISENIPDKEPLHIQALRKQVEIYFKEMGLEVEKDENGDYLFSKGSTGIVLSLDGAGEYTFIDFQGVVVSDIKTDLTKEKEIELYKTLLHWNVGNNLGKFALLDNNIIIKYRMLANDLTKENLEYAIVKILDYADSLDEILADMSGGVRQIDII